MEDALSTAISMHRSGQLGPASQLYQKILAREQENAEALHLLGVLNHQQGQHARAIELIGRAVALRPNSPFTMQISPRLIARWRFRSRRWLLPGGTGDLARLSRSALQPRCGPAGTGSARRVGRTLSAAP